MGRHIARRDDNRWTVDLLNGNLGQEREGGDDKSADGGMTSLHM